MGLSAQLTRLVDLVLWRKSRNDFNTVGATCRFVSFWWLQIFRLLFLVMMAVDFILLFFIFFRFSFGFINFWSLVLSFSACGFLFIQSGKEVCLQSQIKNGTNKNKWIESDLWPVAILLYNQALPFVITSNVLYWVNDGVKEDIV